MCHPFEAVPCIVCQVFGSPWSEGRLYFEDMSTSEETNMVILQRQRGTRSRQRNVLLGSPPQLYSALPAGTIFNGRIRHGLPDLMQVALVMAALRSISSFGSHYGIGWGRCTLEASVVDNAGRQIAPAVLSTALAEGIRARQA